MLIVGAIVGGFVGLIISWLLFGGSPGRLTNTGEWVSGEGGSCLGYFITIPICAGIGAAIGAAIG